ncbi:hypothetical protein [uncultured Shewanella sp.]|uniref:hypothetical protein n=1 Tax=uncultured Shewanella sp. TaxID=173975 RepID=UPI002604439A|nr:hypothetical protein [uncultured Shewanella sp.]
MNYLVNNKGNRDHAGFYGEGAIFDLERHQHGYVDLEQAKIGDSVFVINKKRMVEFEYEITAIKKTTDCIVLFGNQLANPNVFYPAFVEDKSIKSPKLQKQKMLRGFNVAAFT